jgi:hypothetical protein
VVRGGFPVGSRQRRERALASDSRAGVWARGKARRLQYAYIRSHWLWLGGVLAASVVVLTIACYFTPSEFVRGVLVGGGLVGVASALWLWVVQVTGTAPTMMGDLGEQFTAAELRTLSRSGWSVVNHVLLKTRDIDHVLVGPGGVIAVETKWSSIPWTVDPPESRVRDAVEAVRAHARDLTLWHNLKSLGVGQVRPVVILWGSGTDGIPLTAVDGVTVIGGPAARAWLSTRGSDGLTDEQVRRAWEALDAQCQRRDLLEAEQEPLPLSLGEWGYRVIAALLSACAAFLVPATLVAHSNSILVDVVACIALVAIGVASLRWLPTIRYLAVGWLIGLLGVGVVALIAIIQWMTK